MPLRNEEFSFPKLIEQINTIFSGQLDEFYIGNSVNLRQVLINILGNAVKFTKNGGKVELSVEKTADFGKKSTLRFTIKDTGIGMSKEYLPKIFDTFSQERATTLKFARTS